MKLNLGLVAL